jgi:hypothetical protein
MPFFKTTKDIFVTPWEDELFDPNWMDSDHAVFPPNIPWDYSRELTIEDVDIWEQVYYQSGGLGLYVAWSPYAEFYLITNFLNIKSPLETFYGPMAGEKAYKKAVKLGMPIHLKKLWVEPDDMWLYQPTDSKAVIL